MSPELSHDVFSIFLGTPHTVSYFLRRFLEGDLSEMVSKVYLLDGAVIQKSKNITPERHLALKCRAWQQNLSIWNSSPDLPDPADPDYQVSGAAARTLPSTRAGGQDDVS